MNDAINIKY